VAVPNAVDFVYDSGRDVIYITTPTAIQRYHVGSTRSMAFIAWSGTRQVRALDTDTYAELWRYDFGADIPTGTFLRTSRDGTLLLALLNGSINYLRWTNAVPILTNPPVSQTVFLGNSTTFSVGAMGMGPLSYQWHFAGQDIADATSTVLVVSNAQFTNGGAYSVTVFGPNSSTLSPNAVLTVNGAPQITAQPQGLALPAGTNGAFSVAASAPASVVCSIIRRTFYDGTAALNT
jgi:hypothetical protein